MPYYISDKQPDCQDWATVKEEDGQYITVSCHTSKQDAVDQMVALSLAEDMEPMGEVSSRAAETYTPPKSVQDAAQRAIKWIDEGLAGDGFTVVGRRRASQLASGEPVSADIVNRMRSYFARHQVDKDAEGFNVGENGFPTPGRVAWDAWGGDAGKTWAESLDTSVRNENGDPIVICDIDGTLINAGNLVQRVYDYAKSEEGALFILTGRPESERDATVRELNRLGVTYSRLIMNSGSTADSTAYKKATAEELLKTYNIVQAIENNPDTVAAYRSLGIETIEPKDIPQSASRWMKAAWIIKNKLEGNEARTLGDRELRVNHVEFRATGDGMSFEGYASVFNSDSEPLPFIERVAPGAFKRSLTTRNRIMLLWNHDHSQPLASTRNGSLNLTEDSVGLKVRATLPDTQLGRDIKTLVQTGVIDSMSFGFSVKKDTWSADGNIRTLQDVTLYEVSLVSSPAYEGTAGTVSVREINPEVLADSLTKLEAGEELDEAQAATLTEVVGKLSGKVDEEVTDIDTLELKKAKLKLYMKGL
jgi:HK97 family phage prohead protease